MLRRDQLEAEQHKLRDEAQRMLKAMLWPVMAAVVALLAVLYYVDHMCDCSRHPVCLSAPAHLRVQHARARAHTHTALTQPQAASTHAPSSDYRLRRCSSGRVPNSKSFGMATRRSNPRPPARPPARPPLITHPCRRAADVIPKHALAGHLCMATADPADDCFGACAAGTPWRKF